MQRFLVHAVDIHAGAPEVYLNHQDASRLGLDPLDRVHIALEPKGLPVTAIVNVAGGFARPGRIGLSSELWDILNPPQGALARLAPAPRPLSLKAIRKKLDGILLTPAEVELVIRDIASANLSPVEVTAWACALQVHGMDMEEMAACVKAMVDTGERIHFEEGPILDVHSIGGVPGNKYAPITVSIVAANGVLIPKTSSRAISSACGTADFMEVMAPVALSAQKVKAITQQVGGTLCWGGAVNLAPADDVIIRAEYPLLLDPPAQIIASVLAKKVAVGASRVLIDLPSGRGAKLATEEAARKLGHDFVEVGRRVGLDVQCVLTQGNQPLGNAIGPVLEAQEALQVLEGAQEPAALVEKACSLAGRLLEMAGKAEPGKGLPIAQATLRDGRALAKFRDIVAAQGGRRELASKDLQPGPLFAHYTSPAAGAVLRIDNKDLVQVARAAGSPVDRGAGLLLAAHPGDRVAKDQKLMTIYAENSRHLADALALAVALRPFTLEGPEVLGFVS